MNIEQPIVVMCHLRSAADSCLVLHYSHNEHNIEFHKKEAIKYFKKAAEELGFEVKEKVEA